MTRSTGKRVPANARKQQTGWHHQARMRMGEVSFRPGNVVWAPTRWDLLLRDLELDEARVLVLLEDSWSRLSAAAAAVIRQWVMRHYRRAFVPEPVLRALGLSDEDVFSVAFDREACARRARTSWEARGKRHGSAGLGE